MLEGRHTSAAKKIYLIVDNVFCRASRSSWAPLAERADWLHVFWFSRYNPQLTSKDPDRRYLRRDTRIHLALTFHEFVEGIRDSLDRLGVST